jgi:hypothetical protein
MRRRVMMQTARRTNARETRSLSLSVQVIEYSEEALCEETNVDLVFRYFEVQGQGQAKADRPA